MKRGKIVSSKVGPQSPAFLSPEEPILFMTCLLLGSAVFFLRTVGFFAAAGPRIEWRITWKLRGSG
nr:MAG TPA: hypothetical protein [Caudoviricetes sp.]